MLVLAHAHRHASILDRGLNCTVRLGIWLVVLLLPDGMQISIRCLCRALTHSTGLSSDTRARCHLFVIWFNLSDRVASQIAAGHFISVRIPSGGRSIPTIHSRPNFLQILTNFTALQILLLRVRALLISKAIHGIIELWNSCSWLLWGLSFGDSCFDRCIDALLRKPLTRVTHG